jgi:aspartate aminotransferase-like enzyme
VNTLSPGQKLLVASIGYFGERMAKTARAFGVEVIEVPFSAGQAVDPAIVVDHLEADPSIDTVFITHNETSTGVLNPLEAFTRAVRAVRPDVLLLVDGISSVGSVPVQPEAWGCDVIVAGSQKGWMIPPGLVFVSISERAWQVQKEARAPKMYFDWRAHKRSLDAGQTPWTPAVSLFFGLEVALGLMREEGLARIFEKHEQWARYTREGLADLGLRLVADPRHASPTVTAAYVPEDVAAGRLIEALRERHGVVLAGGQGELEGRVIRIGHMGWVNEADLAAVLRALQVELNSANVRTPTRVTA